MQEKIKELLNRAKEEIKKLRDRKGLNELRVRFLGKSGEITALFFRDERYPRRGAGGVR